MRSTVRSKSTVMGEIGAISMASSQVIDIKSEVDEYEAILKYRLLKNHEDEKTKQER